MRLIDGDKLHLKLLDMEFPIQDQDPILDAMDDCVVDAAPVVHGRWINQSKPDGDNNVTTSCSRCLHTDTHAVGMEVPFCWFCGAKMDLQDSKTAHNCV